jgi:hypothetical protein
MAILAAEVNCNGAKFVGLTAKLIVGQILSGIMSGMPPMDWKQRAWDRPVRMRTSMEAAFQSFGEKK